MFSDAINKISKSVFPIFKQKIIENRLTIGVVGTGFFIDREGSFLTACHVIDNVPHDFQVTYWGNLPYHHTKYSVNIEEIRRNNDYDIFIGKIPQQNCEPVEFGKNNPQVGKSLCLCGYPMAEIHFRPPNNIDTRNVRVYYQPTYVLDGWSGKINEGGQRREYNGFMTRDSSYPGMSGGPVFDVGGIVYGMDVACFHRKIPQKGEVIRVDNGISIYCERLLEFINSENGDNK